jgi:Family of unknown function (DUF5670)
MVLLCTAIALQCAHSQYRAPINGCCAIWINMGLKEVPIMVWTFFLFLIVLWFVGVVTGYTLGGMVHILLLLAVASVAIRLITGRRLT